MIKSGSQAAKTFELGVSKLYQQNRPSILPKDTDCISVYFAPNGLKCIIGFLLTKENILKYNIDNTTRPSQFPDELIKKILGDDINLSEGRRFLNDMQEIHDKLAYIPYNFRSNLKKKAMQFCGKWHISNSFLNNLK